MEAIADICLKELDMLLSAPIAFMALFFSGVAIGYFLSKEEKKLLNQRIELLKDQLNNNSLTPNITIEKKNRLISNLRQHKASISEVKVAYETGQNYYANELCALFISAGLNALILNGAANGHQPGLTIEAHDEDDAKILFDPFLNEGIKITKIIN